MKSKKQLVEEFIRIYYGNKITNNLLLNYYKLFLAKIEVINEMKNDADVLKIYNVTENMNDLKEIIDEIKGYDTLKEKIYEIYKN